MKGPMIIFLVAVFLLAIVAYLAQDTEPDKRLGSKAYHMLLLGLMRLDIALAYGVRYVQLGLEYIFKGYHIHGLDAAITEKQRRMQEYRKSNLSDMDYVGRSCYNRKILE
ncbi:MAG: hypothetical protein IJ390_09270 [Lachnospiraceae bacterium]|nr:hypothetical protein [Lachnospiraceae bacterium]